MSTQSTICVKVRKEDKGKALKCDLSKITLKSNNPFDIKVEEIERKITPIKLDKDYIRIYVHWSGDANGVGRELLNNYDYEKALNLILLGDESSIIGGCEPYVGRTDYPEEWEDTKPMTLENVEQDEMLTYLLDDDDKWYVAEGNGEFELVSDLLED